MNLIDCLKHLIVNHCSQPADWRLFNHSGHATIALPAGSETTAPLTELLADAGRRARTSATLDLKPRPGGLALQSSLDGVPHACLDLAVDHFRQPLEAVPGRRLTLGLISDDSHLRAYLEQLGQRFNFLCLPGDTDATHIDVYLVDQRQPPRNSAPLGATICLTPASSEPGLQHQLSWPFFDTELLAQLNDLRHDLPLQVLVADDSACSRLATQLMLEKLACRVTPAHDGREALQLAEQTPFDVLFLDEIMPGLRGSEVARQVASGAGPSARALRVALTGASEEALRDAGEHPLHRYIHKPITRSALADCLLPWHQESPSPD